MESNALPMESIALLIWKNNSNIKKNFLLYYSSYLQKAIWLRNSHYL